MSDPEGQQAGVRPGGSDTFSPAGDRRSRPSWTGRRHRVPLAWPPPRLIPARAKPCHPCPSAPKTGARARAGRSVCAGKAHRIGVDAQLSPTSPLPVRPLRSKRRGYGRQRTAGQWMPGGLAGHRPQRGPTPVMRAWSGEGRIRLMQRARPSRSAPLVLRDHRVGRRRCRRRVRKVVGGVRPSGSDTWRRMSEAGCQTRRV